MAKFNLKTGQMQKKQGAETVASGAYPAMIVHIVDVGDYAYIAGEPCKRSTAFTFQLPSGVLITKIIPNSIHELSIMMTIVSSVGDAEDLEDLLGKKLVLEVEANKFYPKIKGYYSLEFFDEFQDTTFPDIPSVFLLPEGDAESIDVKSNIAVIKTLPNEIRKIMLRARSKKATL
ncbi:MAG: hypothetical protein WC856_15135 [Methylococcaceae bacterium]|jgi:hypothetical protein